MSSKYDPEDEGEGESPVKVDISRFEVVQEVTFCGMLHTNCTLCYQSTQEHCSVFGTNCYLCFFDGRTGLCSSQNRARFIGSCNSLNLSVLWNGIKNTYNRWPAATIFSLLALIFFFSYLIFVRVSSPGEDQSIMVAEINKTLALGGFLMLCILLSIVSLFVTCGHEILNQYSSSPMVHQEGQLSRIPSNTYNGESGQEHNSNKGPGHSEIKSDDSGGVLY